MLTIYNTLTQKKQPFKPIKEGQIQLYVCGITVYDKCHIGHARVYITFDAIIRYLKSRGYDVIYVRNITDIDDKIIKRAKEQNIEIDVLTEKTIAHMHADFDTLGLLRPTHEPRATQFLQHMIDLIATLMDKKVAYQGDNGDVYFSVSAYKKYGELSHRDLEQLQQGARVEIDPFKKHPLDFVLWKSAKPHEVTYPAPFGAGRPGWHTECSAMAMHYFGSSFDIHGGGFDLQFPHHENERAQSEAATSHDFVNYWMHVGFLNINQEKMSKSLNNFFTIEEVLEKHHPEAVRMMMLMTHYRSELHFSNEQLVQAKDILTRFYLGLRDVTFTNELNEDYCKRFDEAMSDDFNIPAALVVLHEVLKELNRLKAQHLNHVVEANTLKHLGGLLGLFQHDPALYFQNTNAEVDVAWIEAKIEERRLARANKAWAKSDEIRDELKSKGVTLEDGASGTTWRVD